MKITIHDASFSQTDQPKLLRVDQFSFKKEFYRKSKYKMQRQEYDSYAVDFKGNFLTGLIPNIKNYCNVNNIQLEIEINPEIPPIMLPQTVSSLFTLRDDQQTCIDAALTTDRGVIKAPTGSGKTVLISAIISAFPTAKILFLCHTLSLLKQTQEEFNNYGLGPSSIVGGGHKDCSGRIIISTVQSFSKAGLLEPWHDKFDIVFVDESHHVSTVSGLYSTVLSKLTATRRYGMTATLPTSKEGLLAMEGLIGPVIADFTIEEAIDQEILAVPKVELISVPTNDLIRDMRQYSDRKIKDDCGKFVLDRNGDPVVEKGIYNLGICEYRRRNRLIIETALEKNKKGESVLIYVILISHGEQLMEIAERMGVTPIFIRGSSDSELREETRQALNEKRELMCICTISWQEGINIKSLDTIILAGGGKSEIALIQKIGRGLRRTNTKTKATIVDFLDSGRYLSEHCVSRLKIYAEKGWL